MFRITIKPLFLVHVPQMRAHHDIGLVNLCFGQPEGTISCVFMSTVSTMKFCWEFKQLEYET